MSKSKQNDVSKQCGKLLKFQMEAPTFYTKTKSNKRADISAGELADAIYEARSNSIPKQYDTCHTCCNNERSCRCSIALAKVGVSEESIRQWKSRGISSLTVLIVVARTLNLDLRYFLIGEHFNVRYQKSITCICEITRRFQIEMKKRMSISDFSRLCGMNKRYAHTLMKEGINNVNLLVKYAELCEIDLCYMLSDDYNG